jgi:DNA-binding MarR family transcriptional regulator
LRNLIGRIKEGEFAGNKVSFRQQQASEELQMLEEKFIQLQDTTEELGDRLGEVEASTEDEQATLNSAKQLHQELTNKYKDTFLQLYLTENVINPSNDLTSLEYKVLSVIYTLTHQTDRSATTGQIRSEINASLSAVFDTVDSLIKRKYLKRVGRGKQASYVLTKRGENAYLETQKEVDRTFQRSYNRYKEYQEMKGHLRNYPPPDINLEGGQSEENNN